MPYEEIIKMKKDAVVFFLAMRDQLGLTQDLSFFNSLIKIHDFLINKMIQALDKQIYEIMDNEDYMLVVAKNGEDYFRYVDKYDLDLTAYLKNISPSSQDDEMNFPSLKSSEAHNSIIYPLYLPFTKSVPKLNDLLAIFLDQNLSYWQFLFADKTDFNEAY